MTLTISTIELVVVCLTAVIISTVAISVKTVFKSDNPFVTSSEDEEEIITETV